VQHRHRSLIGGLPGSRNETNQLIENTNPSTALSKTEFARSRVRDDIMQGRYAPGHPIPERLVAQELEVSRVPVREALIQLQRDGLVSITPGRGAYVRSLTGENMQSLYETREALEGMASRLAAERMGPEVLAPFTEKYHALLSDSLSMDGGSVAKLGNEFHDTIIRGSRNSVIIELSAVIADRVELCRRMCYGQASRPLALRAAEEHLKIAEAIDQADPEVAERRMREHIAWWAQFLRTNMVGDGPRHSR
jgi:DNA-binding GntR family transcriptional regulator